GESHALPRRPRPAVWRSAITTRPSGAPARASARTTSLVEPVSGKYTSCRNRAVSSPASTRSGVGASEGLGKPRPTFTPFPPRRRFSPSRRSAASRGAGDLDFHVVDWAAHRGMGLAHPHRHPLSGKGGQDAGGDRFGDGFQ